MGTWAVTLAVGIVMAFFGFRTPVETPSSRMVNFAMQQLHRSNNSTDFQTMLLEKFDTFVKSACVEGHGLESVRAAAARQLTGLPDEVRSEILDMAFHPNVSIEGAHQNMTNSMAQEGRAFFHMYYVNTKFTLPDHYSSCILATGIDLTIGEVVVGEVEEHTTDVLAYEPCRCGWIACEKCPILREIITKRPVFSRPAGTVGWHRDIQNVLAGMAARQVTGLSSAGPVEERLLTAWNLSLTTSAMLNPEF